MTKLAPEWVRTSDPVISTLPLDYGARLTSLRKWSQSSITVQITFVFIDFRVCDFAFAFKTQNPPCVSRFKRILFSDRCQFAF